MAEKPTPQNTIEDSESKLAQELWSTGRTEGEVDDGVLVAKLDSAVDEAAVFLTEREQSIIVGYDKQGLSFEEIASKLGLDWICLVRRQYKRIHAGIKCTLDHLSLWGTTFNQIAVLSSTSTTSFEEATSNLTVHDDTWVLVPHYYHAWELTSDNMAEEKPFIPMDDPRRIYKITGTNYAMCHPALTGSWAGHKNTPEEQKALDDFHRANSEEVKHMTYEELLGYIEATKKSVNEKDKADRLLVEDLCRQQDELRAQREVERRVYYRQRALKEDKKKEKEEKARARAIARGEIMDDGEAVDGSSSRAQDSGEAMTGIIENGATNGGSPRVEEGNSSAHGHGTNGGQISSATGTDSGQGEAFGGEHAASASHGSGLSHDQTMAEGLASAVDNTSEARGPSGTAWARSRICNAPTKDEFGGCFIS